jgi:hypothetical protein
MDSRAQKVPRDSEIINELMSRVTHGFDSANTTRDSEIINETVIKGDAWIRRPKLPLWTQN